jgi:hypothetical protein
MSRDPNDLPFSGSDAPDQAWRIDKTPPSATVGQEVHLKGIPGLWKVTKVNVINPRYSTYDVSKVRFSIVHITVGQWDLIV